MSHHDTLFHLKHGKELTFLLDTVEEIAAENNIDAKEAVSKFLSDV